MLPEHIFFEGSPQRGGGCACKTQGASFWEHGEKFGQNSGGLNVLELSQSANGTIVSPRGGEFRLRADAREFVSDTARVFVPAFELRAEAQIFAPQARSFQSDLRVDARVFTPEVVEAVGAQQVGEETGVGGGNEVTGLDGLLQAWQRTSNGQAKLQRVCDELVWYHNLIGKPLEPSEIPELVDDAEAVKGAMAQLMPKGKRGWEGVLSKCAAFWNRISLHHLRFRGSRYFYAVVKSLDGRHDLLTLRVPPKTFFSREAKLEHAEGQATYRDDAQGRFQPGLRVSDEFVRMIPEHLSWLARDFLSGGHAMQLVEQPAKYRRGNYHSYESMPGKAHGDLERQVAAGFLEKLNYNPKIIHSQEGVFDAEKDKFRPVVDATRSGLNECLQKMPCRYDMLRDLLKMLQFGDFQAAFDLKDAFYLWPRAQVYCDYQGIQGPGSSPEVFRYRYLPMGMGDSPGLQQAWAEAIKCVVNEKVLAPLCREQLLSNGMEPHLVKKASFSEIAAMYMDDGKIRFPAAFSLGQAEEQFKAVLAFFTKHGIEFSAKKSVWPDAEGEYVGVHLDTASCVASVQQCKAEKYTRALDLVLEAGSVVGRRQLASAVGKLQFVADVAPGMRRLLLPLYEALGDLVVVPEPGDEWGDGVMVGLGEDAVEALLGAKKILASESDLRRRWYPHPDPVLAGFWEGKVLDSHRYMDEHSFTSHGVPVVTGDASGDQGAAHHAGEMLIWEYPPEESAPVQSSNYRELDTVVRPLEEWGHRFAGGRCLTRSDNSTSVAVVNKRGTNSRNLQQLSARLVAVCKKHDIDLAAVHIPGDLNGLADRGSRVKRSKDYGDWMFSKAAFEHVEGRIWEQFGVKLTVDGGADAVGSNRQLHRYYSAVNSIFDHDLRGEHLYVNPDFDIIKEVLEHFQRGYVDPDYCTSGTFVLPVWPDRSFWKLLKGARLVAYYPSGVPLFTSPDWRDLESGEGEYRFDSLAPRVHRGDTRWPVIVAHFPPLLARRSGGVGGAEKTSGVGRLEAQGGKGAKGALPVLQGDQARDLHLLSGVRPCFVY